MQVAKFTSFRKQLDQELHSLSSESKRRNSTIKHASDKSIDILKTIQNIEELVRHPDFVTPLVLACSSRNAKLTSIAMQCLQGLASVPSIPESRIPEVLDGFIEATQLAMEIQLKVLQIVPIFFKTYAKYIVGPQCKKLLQCCSSLLQLPNKAPVVFGTASATLQQLIDEVFERVSYEWAKNEDDESATATFEVMISNNETVKVGPYHYDANRLLNDLCSLVESSTSSSSSTSTQDKTDQLLDIKDIQTDYGLEILESVLKNSKKLFLTYPDLQFILRTKTVPLLLRYISSSKHFSTIFRSSRCIQLLIKKDYLSLLELELEVIISLLIHGISLESNISPWQRILSLEIFKELSQDFEMIRSLFITYDLFPDRKHIVNDLLQTSFKLIDSKDFTSFLGHSEIIQKVSSPLITSETTTVKTRYIDMLDKTNPPSVNLAYIISLVLSISNNFSEGLNNHVLTVCQAKGDDKNEASKEESELTSTKRLYEGLFESLFQLHKLLLYSSMLDSHIFHSLVRAFQKLAHAAGLLHLNDKLNVCLDLFSKSIVNNTLSGSPTDDMQTNIGPQSQSSRNSSKTSTPRKLQSATFSDKKSLHLRSFNSRNVSLFRALLSLSISIGSFFNTKSWQIVFLTWQWVSYFIYGPSADFMEAFYANDIPPAPTVSKSDLLSIETSIKKLFENTQSYSSDSFQILLESVMIEAKKSLSIPEEDSDSANGYHPLNQSNELSNCIYNKGFFITQIGELASFNFNRFITEYQNQDRMLWNSIMSFFIKLIANRNISSIPLRLYITRVFTDIIKNIANEVGNMDDQETRASKFSILEQLFTNSLMKTIESIQKLDVTKNEIYDGTIRTESEIIFQILSTLKEILNEFGDLLTQSWSTIFNIINAPFEWNIETALSSEGGNDKEDSSLVGGILQNYIDMIQVSYDVFKLISDDFLQSLPLGVIKYVVDTLVNYATQDKILNISFSSISQFWLVGDYLRLKDGDIVKFDDSKESKDRLAIFKGKLQDNQLTQIISSSASKGPEMYNGLWLYLLKSLIECTKDKRIEVKNGSIQTFFRIVDSHGSCFPTWDLIFIEVLNPFLKEKLWEADNEEISKFVDLTLKGLVDLYPSHFTSFLSSNSNDEWIAVLNLFDKLLKSKSSSVNYVTVINYQKLLKSMIKFPYLPEPIWKKCHEIWLGYNITYSDLASLTPEVGAKTEYDCVTELLIAFQDLYPLVDKYGKISEEFTEKSLGFFNSAARYPLLPEYSQDKTKLSGLQNQLLCCLHLFDRIENREIELLVIYQLTVFGTLCFDTREKIEKKLAHKLTDATNSRIPSFEAISYISTQYLSERLDFASNNSVPLDKDKQILRIVRNLSDVIQRKSFINLGKSENIPLWVISSRCFRKLVEKLLVSFKKASAPNYLQGEVLGIFIDVMSSYFVRESGKTDSLTESSDIEEYRACSTILLQNDVITLLDDERLKYLVESIWYGSFIYETDEYENALLARGETLFDVSQQLSNFDFNDMFGSTVQPPLMSKYNCSLVCLNDLIKFVMLPDPEFSKLRIVTIPFLVVRISLVLRRFICDEFLMCKAPIPKHRKIELTTFLNGLHKIMQFLLEENPEYGEEETLKELKVLYPLILKTIPVSHKVEGIQDDVLNLSLAFTKLMSK
ncbi:Mon2p NDAI_0A06120 [Naumovozyma dairenensis CBS 421]|uniref:Protein MON2 n=1 Tax=Naumovozyma dairenensis (strain ATCC 10597 / BCRC 20456 / CBS 421 / NBRC 0211 / NRRL Y-12639) TaxID=1071378 RepID=G0W4M9_NAUDC|nr:hypothetical protein NDAI_0A06120 [Naumovozyma dairenensis CBS 421]CCD22767.1 hypothetical protein NDAI_0A06120 [Naumovozyma dairenensis CBS 421]